MSDYGIQFTTETTRNTEDHNISDNIDDIPSDEYPPEEIAKGGQDSVQTGFTAVENPVSDPISKNDLLCLEMEMTSHPVTEWEETTTPKRKYIAHNIISGKRDVFISFDIETGREYCGILQTSAETFWIELVTGGITNKKTQQPT